MVFMRNIRFMPVCVIFALISLLAGCGKPAKKVVTLKMAHGLAITHPVHKAMEFLAQRALEKSDSTLVIEIYPNEQLGNEKECLEKLQLGALAMTKVSSSVLENFRDEYKVFALPFLFRDNMHKWKVFQSPIGKKILASGEKIKLKGLVYYDAGFRSFYSLKKPILKPADLKGLKIRTQQSPMAMKMVSSLGGSPTPISWGELYTALQQGVVDGAENNPPSLFTSNHYEVCKHYSLDEHNAVPDVILINTLIWNGLSPEHQAILQGAAEESVAFQRKVWEEFEKESMDKMAAAGVKVYYPDKAPFQELAKAVWKEFEGTVIGDYAKEIEGVQ
jgi:tripartite ATP-independent transporter DctP family solute receptor